jgi:hypothetical protein
MCRSQLRDLGETYVIRHNGDAPSALAVFLFRRKPQLTSSLRASPQTSAAIQREYHHSCDLDEIASSASAFSQ